MKFLMVLSVVFGSTLAAPASNSNRVIPSAEILREVNKLNDDGSYTFGYENSDGSFRMENRDINGYVQGRYGYIDPDGQLQEIDYVAGSVGGQSVGFQSRNSKAPLSTGSQWPNIHTSSQQHSNTRAQDFAFSSVDDNQDGIPDNLAGNRAVHQTPQIADLAPTTTSALPSITPNVVRIVETASPAAIRAPTSVGSTYFHQTADNIRFDLQPIPVTSQFQLTPVRQQVQYLQQQQPVIRNEPTTFVIQEQPTLISSGGQLGGFIQQQPTFTNVLRTQNTYDAGQQPLRGAVRFVNSPLRY